MGTKTATIPWKPLSDKHRQYIKKALDQRMCVAEGAIRSGKTIDHCIIAAAYLETCPDKIHLASGSTIPNAKLNIGACNGFGLENLFRGRCRWGKYKDNEALYLRTQTGEKVVLFSGGGKADSYRRILGNSYGLWIATEINEHYDSDDSRESFIKVAFGRQAAAEKPYTLWDLNPCNPKHRIYNDYIDRYKTGFDGGYQYEHFTMADNLSIDEDRRRQIESQYDKSSVWYRRDILGERTIAAGLIYHGFNEALHATTSLPDFRAMDFGVDVGHSNATVFLAIGTGIDGRAYVVDEYYHSGKDERQPKSPYVYAKDFLRFRDDVMGMAIGAKFGGVYIDPSALGFMAQLRELGVYGVYKANNDVVPGIQTVSSAIDADLLRVHTKCRNLLGEIAGYRWDSKAAEHGEDRPVKENDHAMDALRYFLHTRRNEWARKRVDQRV